MTMRKLLSRDETLKRADQAPVRWQRRKVFLWMLTARRYHRVVGDGQGCPHDDGNGDRGQNAAQH